MDWASQIHFGLPHLDIPNPPVVDHWKEWASQVVHSNLLINVPLPTQIAFPKVEDWRTWASYFINSV